MPIGKWKLLGEYFRTYSNEAYEATTEAADHLASTTLLLLGRKSDDEKRRIVERAQTLLEKFWELAAEEQPLVVAMALLSGIRIHEQMVAESAKRMRAEER